MLRSTLRWLVLFFPTCLNSQSPHYCWAVRKHCFNSQPWPFLPTVASKELHSFWGPWSSTGKHQLTLSVVWDTSSADPLLIHTPELWSKSFKSEWLGTESKLICAAGMLLLWKVVELLSSEAVDRNEPSIYWESFKDSTACLKNSSLLRSYHLFSNFSAI